MSFKACFGIRQFEEIERRNKNLRYFPEDVFRHRRRLHTLLLDTNQIFDIPRNVSRLSHLEKLSISENELERVPAELFNISSLAELDLSRNNLQSLPDSVKTAKSLTVLDVSSNTIASLPDSVAQLRNLTHLCVNDTSLHNLPNSLDGLGRLVVLEARENTLKFLPSSISKLTGLKRLDLGGNDLEELPDTIGGLVNLEELWLDGNDLAQLPVEIGELANLKIMDVTENRLERLPEGLDNLKSLTDLLLTQNSLEELPDGLGSMSSLTLLKADANRLERLPDSIGGLVNLRELVLTDNMLETLPTSIGQLKKLSALSVDRNSLVGIPPEVSYCTSLTILTLRENKLTRLPSDIGMLPNLRIIDLCSNRIESLPTSFMQLPLTALWLSENQSKSMMELQKDSDPVTKEPILTCVLLPQATGQSQSMENLLQLSQAGQDADASSRASQNTGDRVRVAFAPGTADPESSTETKLARHPTPFIKDMKLKAKQRFRNADGRKSPDSKRSSTGSLPSADVATPSLSENSHHANAAEKEDHATTAARNVAFAAATKDENQTDGGKASGRVMRHDTPHPNALLGHAQAAERALEGEEGRKGATEEDHTAGNDMHEDKRVSFSEDVKENGPKGPLKRKMTPYVLDPPEASGEDDKPKAVKLPRRDTPRDLAMEKQRSSEPSEPLIEEGDEEEEEEAQKEVNMETRAQLAPSVQQYSTTLHRKPGESLGFSLSGGINCLPRYRTDNDFVYITRTNQGGVADRDGVLQPGDKIVEVNGVSFLNITHSGAVTVLKAGQETVKITVEREECDEVEIQVTPATPSAGQLEFNEKVDQSIVLEGATNEGEKDEYKTPQDRDPLVEEVTVNRQKEPLGMSIVGGVGTSSLPFGSGKDETGIFISKIVPGSVADRTGVLRMGDRILAVNDSELENVQHSDAVALLVSKSTLTLRVRHDPPPLGLEKIVIQKAPNEKLGLSVIGGAGATSGNPNDEDDEGIFISKVRRGGAASRSGKFMPGQRLIEVNGETLLGSTHQDAVSALLNAKSPVSFLVCHGYTPADGDQLSGASSPVEMSPTPDKEMAPISLEKNHVEERQQPVAEKETLPSTQDEVSKTDVPPVEELEKAADMVKEATQEEEKVEENVTGEDSSHDEVFNKEGKAGVESTPGSAEKGGYSPGSAEKGGYSPRSTPAREEAASSSASPAKGEAGSKKKKRKKNRRSEDEDGEKKQKKKKHSRHGDDN